MTRKIIFLNIALILAGFLSASAQNNVPMPARLNPISAIFESQKPSTIKKANPDRDWWVPDTITTILTVDGKVYMENHKIIYQYNSQGLLREKRDDEIFYFIGNDPWMYNTSVYTYTYDSNNNLLTELQQSTGSRQNIEIISWVNNYQITHTYDSNNNVLTEICQNWENNLWTNNYQIAHTYDSNNNLSAIFAQIWKNNSWTNNYQITHTYDSINNLSATLNQNWENNSWVNNCQITYTYDSNNNMLTEINQNWENNSWVNDYQYTYTYDSNNKMLTEINQKWESNSWINDYQYTYTYDSNNNALNELYQVWWNNSWRNSGLITYTYDSDNNMLTELHQRWISEDSLVNLYKYLMTYDENGNGASGEIWLWIWESWQPINDNYYVKLYYNNMQNSFEIRDGCQKIIASYKKLSDITSISPPVISKSNAVSVYPNPTAGELRIETGELKIKNVGLFDIHGRKILNWLTPNVVSQFSILNSFDISHLPAGVYFIKIATDKGVVTKKIVKR